MAHPKALLIERLRQRGLGKPVYRTHRSGPDHDPTYASEVLSDGNVIGRGEASTKRDAERNASQDALARLDRGDLEVVAPPGDAAEKEFDGPWPIFEQVLSTCLTIAHQRTDPALAGRAAVEPLKDLALTLYQEVLINLGEVMEVEVAEESDGGGNRLSGPEQLP